MSGLRAALRLAWRDALKLEPEDYFPALRLRWLLPPAIPAMR